jgi:hypothetical protein
MRPYQGPARPSRAALSGCAVLAVCLLVAACTSGPSPGDPSREALSELAEAPAVASPDPGVVDRFGGKLYLVLLDDKTHPSLRSGRSLWATNRVITYAPSDGSGLICIPKGFVTDLASIPRLFWTLLPPDGPWVKAAVIHDYLYYTKGSGLWKGHPRSISRAKDYTRPEADWILRDAMKDRHVDGFGRNAIYFAVRFGGQHGWDNSPGARSADPSKLACALEAGG